MTMSEAAQAAPPKHIDPQQVAALVEGRDTRPFALLDVREPSEYEGFHLPGALHVPLGQLPDRLAELPRDKPLIVYCASGRRSLAATALLSGAGFDQALNMPGGANNWTAPGAVGEPFQGFSHLGSSASPSEALGLAYAMELGLGRFYEELAAKAASPDVRQVFDSLARFEHGHVKIVLRIWDGFGLAGSPADAAPPSPELLEGGLTPDQALGNYPLDLNTPETAIDFGMSFEAQALDLYLRLARRAQHPQTAAMLRDLADQERHHLVALGNLLETLQSKRTAQS